MFNTVYAKLDTYDYRINESSEPYSTIAIRFSTINDPLISDVLSEIARAENHIYVERRRFIFLTSTLRHTKNGVKLILHVEEENNNGL